MPPAPKRHCSVILYDLNTQDKDKALQTLLKIACKKYFTQSKDICKLILVNSEKTKNRLNAHYGGYEHVHEVNSDVTLYNPQSMLNIIEDSPPGPANWLEALCIGVKSLSEDYATLQGIVTFQLLFITDLTTLVDLDRSLIREIIDELNGLGAYLYIVGPDIEVPHLIKNEADIKLWMKNLTVIDDNKNLVVAKQILDEVENRVICNYDIGSHLFFSYKNWKGTQPWKVPLAIGTRIEIPAQTMKVLNEGLECKLVSDKSDGAIRVWIDAEDETVEIQEKNVIRGIVRHNKFIEMPDRKMFQVTNQRGFHVLFFTSKTNVPEYHLMPECYYVLPNGNTEVMSILIDSLASQGKYIIARRVYNNNFIPKIVALIPKPDHSPKCFILATLPFAEDIRYDYRERDETKIPKQQIDKNIENYLESIDINKKRMYENFPLATTMAMDPNCELIVNKAADKLFDRKHVLGEPQKSICAGIEIDSGLIATWPERETIAPKEEVNGSDNSDEEDDWKL